MTTPTPRREISAAQAMVVPGTVVALLLAGAWLVARSHAVLFASVVGSAAFAGLWALALFVRTRGSGGKLTLEFSAKPQHWVQAIAQLLLYYWWGRTISVVYSFAPLILLQLVFAYGVDSLLNWWRRGHYNLGFGPWPVVLSINLFLWFRPEWFYWQFAMIVVGFLAKDLIRWQRDGRSAHIFNPSSFPLAIASIFLIASQGSDHTFAEFIANSQHDPPYIYLALLLVSLPGQFVFGVARMTLAAVLTMMAISLTYLQVTGTYLFFDSHIPVPVFLGMHLLFTDPSTSPRSEPGRILFGMMYSVLTAALFVLLPFVGAHTLYDKLLPVPFMNLTVRWIDRMAAGRPLSLLSPSKLLPNLGKRSWDLVYASAWSLVFAVLYATQGVGDRHPGQYLPFWQTTCAEGSDRACRYEEFLTTTYCHNGSGWACNEAGIQLAESRRDPGALFLKGCELGFTAACSNTGRGGDVTALEHAPPRVEDLPVLLRGTKPILTERDPARLLALACSQGWPDSCGATVP